MKTCRTLTVGLLMLAFACLTMAEGEEAAKEVAPATVVKLFWLRIEKGDIDGALSLFAYSDRSKALIPRQRATFAMWSTVMKKGKTTVIVGEQKIIGQAGVVLITSREGKSTVRRDVMYLVRKERMWRLLAYAVPGDSPAHQLDKETAAAMARLKEWARGEMRKAEKGS